MSLDSLLVLVLGGCSPSRCDELIQKFCSRNSHFTAAPSFNTGHISTHWQWYAPFQRRSEDLCHIVCAGQYHHFGCHGLLAHSQVSVGQDVGSNSPLYHCILPHYARGGICCSDHSEYCIQLLHLLSVVPSNVYHCLIL